MCDETEKSKHETVARDYEYPETDTLFLGFHSELIEDRNSVSFTEDYFTNEFDDDTYGEGADYGNGNGGAQEGSKRLVAGADGPEGVSDESWPSADSSEQNRQKKQSLPAEVIAQAVAMFAFEPQHENELGFKEGQQLWILYNYGEGWLIAFDPTTGTYSRPFKGTATRGVQPWYPWSCDLHSMCDRAGIADQSHRFHRTNFSEP